MTRHFLRIHPSSTWAEFRTAQTSPEAIAREAAAQKLLPIPVTIDVRENRSSSFVTVTVEEL